MQTSKDKEVTNLEQLLARIDEATQDHDRVSFGELLAQVGGRSFGPLLLVSGLAALAPIIGDIPGVPTVVGLIVFLIAIQLLFGRKHLWLPHWLLKRSVASAKLCKALKWMSSPARFVDRFLRPRLTILINGTAVYVIAIVCILIAVGLPVTEVVPFSANVAGAALAAFGLSLIAHDGLLALIAFVFTAVTVGLISYSLL